MNKNNIDIILPVYYEQDNIAKVILGIGKNVATPHQTILVIQDEQDPTIPIIKQLQRKNKNIELIKTPDGVGVIKALKWGFKNSAAEIIVVMMADGSDDPRTVDVMIDKINAGYDLVCASRYSENGKRSGGPKLKGFLSFIAGKTLKLLIGLPTSDATNAFKTFRYKILKQITIESVGGFELGLELTVKAHALGYKITEVSTVWQERKKGKSKFKLFTWLPQYLKWYLFALNNKWLSA